jgi:UDP-N-acetyl-D-glucosamine dehydrogenase
VISYHDPYIPQVVETHYSASLRGASLRGASLRSIELTPETLHDADCVVITTNHSAFDAEMIQQHARLIVDLRNVIKEAGDNIFKL